MVFMSRVYPIYDQSFYIAIYRFLGWNDVLGQKLDRLRSLGSQKIVILLSTAWTKAGQFKDLGESKDCPTYVQSQYLKMS